MFLFYHETICCVYSLDNSNEFTQHHYFIEERKDIPKLSPFASWPDAMINPRRFELPMSRILLVPKMIELLKFGCVVDSH